MSRIPLGENIGVAKLNGFCEARALHYTASVASAFQLFDFVATAPSGAAPGGPAEQQAIDRCFIAVQAYWRAICKRRRVDRPLRDLPGEVAVGVHADHRDAADRGRGAAKLSVDVAANQLGQFYSMALSPETRGRFGVFYTPVALADRLLAMVSETGLDWSECKTMDPACGGGAFLVPVALRMIAALCKVGKTERQIIAHLRTHLKGMEIDPFSAWLSQVFVDAALVLSFGKIGFDPPTVVEVCDTLTARREGSFDLVIGNPPYGRTTLPAHLRQRFGASLYGHANLYGVFTHFAVECTRPNGVVGFVTPTSFLGGQYFKNLRGLLAGQAPPAQIDFISDRYGVFDDVLQETVLIVFRKPAANSSGVANSRIKVCQLSASENGRACDIERIGCFERPKEGGWPWMLPRTRESVPLYARIAGNTSRLSDYGYSVSTGQLVWNRCKERLRQVPGRGTLPLIWAECVTADGLFRFTTARRSHAPFFLVRSDEPHLVTSRPCLLMQRTTAKEQTRRLVAAPLPAAFLKRYKGVVVENHLNILHSAIPKPALSVRALSSLLNSKVVDRVYRLISGSVAVSAYELGSLPLPPPESLQGLERLRDLSQIERLVERAYGLDP